MFGGRGRARGPNLKFSAGAGAKIFFAGGRGRAPARKPPHGRPRAPTRANLKIYNYFRNLNFVTKPFLILFFGKNNINHIKYNIQILSLQILKRQGFNTVGKLGG
jgi:hypothetical protein